MATTTEPQETMRVTAPVASNTLSVNVFTAPGKAINRWLREESTIRIEA